MSAGRIRLIAGLACVVLCGPVAGRSVEAGEAVCRLPPSAPVSLVILQSGQKVRELAASVRDAQVVRHDAETVIFDDGRVITADVSAAGEHLNALGWGARRIDVAVSFPRRRALPRGSYG
jgi:hypothetical protein